MLTGIFFFNLFGRAFIISLFKNHNLIIYYHFTLMISYFPEYINNISSIQYIACCKSLFNRMIIFSSSSTVASVNSTGLRVADLHSNKTAFKVSAQNIFVASLPPTSPSTHVTLLVDIAAWFALKMALPAPRLQISKIIF